MKQYMSDMSNKILTRFLGNLCSSAHEPMFIGPRTYVHRLMNPITQKGGSLQAKRQGRGSLCTRLVISLLLMMVLGVNSVWSVTITYHIINLGRLDNDGALTANRTEALQFTVTADNVTVGVPDKYKSPLAKNWKYYKVGEFTYTEGTKSYTFNESTTLVEGTSEMTANADIYVTYELDETALSTVGLYDGGVCKIKFPDNYYLKQSYWMNGNTKELNTASDNNNTNTSEFLWKFNIIDPYQITLQSQSLSDDNCFDFYVCSKNGNFGDIRLNATISGAKDTKVWVFGLLNGGESGTYRLIVTDGYKSTPTDGNLLDSFGHGYLNNKRSGHKTTYQLYNKNSYDECDLTFEPLTKDYIIVNNSGESLVHATTTDYPLEVPDVIKSPLALATYTYYSDAECTNELTAVGSTTTIYVRYTTNDDLDLSGEVKYNVAVGGTNYLFASDATTVSSATTNNSSNANYNWMLYGDDPYQVSIKNFANSKYITYNVSSGAVSLSDEGNTFFLHTGDDGKYELVATTSDDLSTSGYYSFGVVNNTPGLYASSSYPTGNAAIQTVFEPSNVTQTYTFHIINNSGVEAISASTASALIVGTTITESMIPGIIKSPAASNYTFYPSAADASAGTNEITLLPYPSADVYVRYDTNDIFNLSGELKYNVAVGGTNYLFASDATTVSYDDTSDNKGDANHKWTLNGDDAYQITLKNVDRNRYITYDVSEGEAAPTLSNSGKTFFLRTGSGNGNYELVATTSGDFTTSGYYSLGVVDVDDTPTPQLCASSSYPTGNSAIQTTFETTYASITTAPVAKTLTYNGASQVLLTVGEAENGIMQYRLGETGGFSPTVPRATNAGTYSVYYKVKGAEGFADLIVAEPIVVTISAKVVKDNPNTEAGESAVSIVFSGIPAGGYTYDGTAKTPGITVKDDNIVIAPSEYTVNITNNTSAGTATVTITDNEDGNYIVSGAKTFTINKAPLTVTFNDKTITYGDDPAFEVVYSGFVNDETEETEGVLDGSLVVSGYAQYGNVGTYTITPGGLTSDNYEITFVAGKLTVNQKEVGITWGEATFTYNGSEQKPTATATGTVNYDEIGVTVTGGQINVGTGYTATASALTGEKAGNYKLPSANTTTFSIGKAPLTITANDHTITYGDLPTHNGVTYDHFVGNDDESVLSVKVHYHFNYKQYDNVGNYEITLSDAAATNYDITLVSGTLTVVQKEVGLEWGETTLPYTGSEQTPTLTLSGIVNNDDVGVTVSGGQTNLGTYTATASALTGTKAGNYTLPDENTTTFTIGKATLTVTANDHTITYGDAPADGGVTYSGFINGDNEIVLDGALAYDYDYNQYDDIVKYEDEEVVPYTITPKGLTSGKYNITFEKGTLTVNPKEVGITWDESSFSCDGNPHAPTPTINNTDDLVNGDSDNVTVTVTLSANTGSSLEEDGTAVNAGHYRAVATLKIGEEEAGNYKPVPAIQPFTIDSKIIGDGIEPATGITIVTTDGNNVTVTDGETQLVQDTHYTIETETQGVDKYITVTGKGNYSGAARVLYVKPAFYQPDGDTQYAAVYRATSDLAEPTDITPYIVKKVNPSVGTLIISPVGYIPEGVPVVLVANSNITGFQASAKPANVTAITAETEISNLLKVAPAEGVEVEAAQVYMFNEGEFVLTLSGSLPQGYFYLDNPNYHATGTGQGSNSRLRMVIDNSTGIDDGRGEMEEAGDEKWYTLDGRRLNGIPTQKGIYIVRSAEGRLQGKNGKKVIIR